MNDTAPSPPTTAATIPRGVRSLLTGRWHRSSWVVAALVLVLLVFCNVPGQVAIGPVRLPNADWQIKRQYEHGWPSSWAVREFSLDRAWWTTSPHDDNCWAFWADRSHFHLPALVFNIAMVFALAGAGGALFEIWRRRRTSIWQLHLRDLLGILLLVALASARYTYEQRCHRREFELAGQIPVCERGPPIGSWRLMNSRGITWLRRLAGDEHFRFLDRSIAVGVEPFQLRQVTQLQELRCLLLDGDFTSVDLKQLQEASNLNVLGLIGHPRLGLQPRTRVTMPRLPRLRALTVVDVDCRGLEQLPALECLTWTGPPVDDSALRRFSALRSLRRLELLDGAISADGLAHLQSAARLRSLSVCDLPIDDRFASQFGKLRQLTELELRHCEWHGDQLRHLASLPRLESLNLAWTVIDDEELVHLTRMPALKKLNLTSTDSHITSRRISLLTQLTGLRELTLTLDEYRDEDRQRIRSKLPQCRVVFEPSFPLFEK